MDSEKNGYIAKTILGLIFAITVGCTVAWVGWVYGSIGELSATGKTNAVNIAALQESVKAIVRVESKVDKLIEMHLAKQ